MANSEGARVTRCGATTFVRRHFEEFANRQDLSAATAFQRFPDIHVTIEDIIAEGDRVVVRTRGGRRIRERGIRLSSAAL